MTSARPALPSGTTAPSWRIVLAVLLACGLLAVYLDGGGGGILSVLDRITAVTTHRVLLSAGLPASLDGTTLAHPAGFGLRIEFPCTVLLPALIVAVFLLSAPVSTRRMLTGIAAGVLVLGLLNLLRIAGLYFVGVNSAGHFSLAHDWIGQGTMAISIFVYLAWWSRRPG